MTEQRPILLKRLFMWLFRWVVFKGMWTWLFKIFLWFILSFRAFHLSFCPIISCSFSHVFSRCSLEFEFPCHNVPRGFSSIFPVTGYLCSLILLFTKKWLIIHNSPQICESRYLINQSLTWLISHLFDMTMMTYTQQNDWLRIFLTCRIRNKMLRTISPVGALSRCKRILDIDCSFVKLIEEIESVVGQIRCPRIFCRRLLQSDTEQFHIIRTNVTQTTLQILMLFWCSN